jgi:hypothetical protein
MAENYVLLETIELTQVASSVTFDLTGITGYTDLKIEASTRASVSGAQNINVSFNGSSVGFSSVLLYGTGSTAASIKYPPGSPTNISAVLAGTDYTANTFGSAEWYISDYAGSSNKCFSSDSVTENNATQSFIELFAQLWSNTAAITSITLATQSGNFIANSTFSLYGIAAFGTTPVTAPFASGGNIVANDGTYWYHAFLSSGTFTPLKALTCDYLVIAGGGSGGAAYVGGGGGAGGLRSTVTATGGGGSLETPISVTAQSYAITVGAGGSAVNPESSGNAGSNSVFSTITSVGGGFGANGGNNIPGGNGGSGGGTSRSYAGGTGTSGQGFAGGSGGGDVAGGGGGAGIAGYSHGPGGAGVAISAFASPTLTGVSNFYAGGGGGGNSGAGGSGGGGAGHPTAAASATRNTGSGGGGARTYSPGSSGAGGSGLVIIRYAMV